MAQLAVISYCNLWQENYILYYYSQIWEFVEVSRYISFITFGFKSNLREFLYKMQNISFHQSQLYFSFVADTCKAFAR